jgi:ParB/RepB/Spo0J family partition protein
MAVQTSEVQKALVHKLLGGLVPPDDPPAGSPAEGNGEAPAQPVESSGAELGSPAKKKGRPKKEKAPTTSTTISLPRGVTLSEEVEIPLKRLRPTQNRDADDSHAAEEGAGGLNELATSLLHLGQLFPCIVRADEGSSGSIYDILAGSIYDIVTGNRRFHAAFLAGLKSLRCRIYHGSDDALAHVISFVENTRLKESSWSLALKLRAAEDTKKIDRKQLEALTGKSKSTISEMIAATKLPPEWRKRIEVDGEDLYAVLREHKAKRKEGGRTGREPPTATASEQPAAANGEVETTTTEPPTPASTTTAPEEAPAAPVTPPAKTTAASPAATYSFDEFRHGGVILTIAGETRTPSRDEAIAAVRHALNHLMLLANRAARTDAQAAGDTPRATGS